MLRQARTIAETSVYHAILRGVKKQQLFEGSMRTCTPDPGIGCILLNEMLF